jgi:hypothetical protein
MAQAEAVARTEAGAAVLLTTRGGTHTFMPYDRLWVSGVSRPVTEWRPGDLVAFLGRVVAVRFAARGALPDATRPSQDADSHARLPSMAA